ncbi:MAG: RlpA-like double-psi beta-barrel domain-containing protein [Solirubrobacterales bacterium]|nr:RlpA-like double-psi beta-barrel domain-containing protein [Solirubrobacterales bacterium]
MRPTRRRLRDLRRAEVAIGALILAIPAGAAAVSAGQAQSAAPPPTAALPAHLQASHVRFGRKVVLTGTASAADAGRTAELEFASVGQRAWSPLASATIGSNGAFRVSAQARHSGMLRVLDASANASTAVPAAGDPGALSPTVQRIIVTPVFQLHPQAVTALAGSTVHVRGRLLPGVSGRRIRLEARSESSWHTVATASTGGRGGFDLRYVPSASGTQTLRVRFAGDGLNSHAGTAAGEVTTFQTAVASWYDDAGGTACGFHAYFGVANRSLPCGTKVTIGYGGHTVTATVDDRGPYVGGRDWDLNQNSAAALGFDGVGTVWTSS